MSASARRRTRRVLRVWSVASLAFWVALLAAAIASTTNVQAAPPLEQRRAEPQTTVDDVSAGVMCPSCDSTLDQSNSPAAQQMRAWVEEAVDAGWTEQEIRAGLVDEYGGDEAILAVPRNDGLGRGIWIAPAVVVLGAVLAAVVTLRRWKRDARGRRSHPDRGTRTLQD